MPHSSCPTTQTSFAYAPVGIVDKLRAFLAGMVRFEPAARAIYAENARIRDNSRHWLM